MVYNEQNSHTMDERSFTPGSRSFLLIPLILCLVASVSQTGWQYKHKDVIEPLVFSKPSPHHEVRYPPEFWERRRARMIASRMASKRNIQKIPLLAAALPVTPAPPPSVRKIALTLKLPEFKLPDVKKLTATSVQKIPESGFIAHEEYDPAPSQGRVVILDSGKTSERVKIVY